VAGSVSNLARSRRDLPRSMRANRRNSSLAAAKVRAAFVSAENRWAEESKTTRRFELAHLLRRDPGAVRIGAARFLPRDRFELPAVKRKGRATAPHGQQPFLDGSFMSRSFCYSGLCQDVFLDAGASSSTPVFAGLSLLGGEFFFLSSAAFRFR